MKNAALLKRIRTSRNNVRFGDFVRLVEAMGFEFDRRVGSHAFYRHPCGAVLNLQEFGGEAKPYQIRQFLAAVDENGLEL